MPIKIPDNLPAKEILNQENIFTMDESVAYHQDIRPLRIALLNLMPTKETTETQLLRLIGNTPLQVEFVLLHPKTHTSKNTSAEHLEMFYKTFDDIKDEKLDGMIITGAPVEQMEFEDVNYWEELTQILDWSKHNVTSTLHICWAAQAGLYHHFGVRKFALDNKMFGVFPHTVQVPNTKLLRGFDEVFSCTAISVIRIYVVKTLSNVRIWRFYRNQRSQVFISPQREDGKHIFVTGHSEYDACSLKWEYDRDVSRGLSIDIPKNYYPNNDPSNSLIILGERMRIFCSPIG